MASLLAAARMGHGRLPSSSAAEQIMGMPAHRMPTRRWTEAEFYAGRDAAPKGERWELVDGEVLVTPSPHWTHQRVVTRLLILLVPYVKNHVLGEVFTAPLDVKLAPGLVLQPDVLVVPPGELVKLDDIVQRLLLAIETISPSSARHDRVTKRPHYQRNRVPDYWIVDGEAQIIERWRPHDTRPEILSDELIWHPEGAPVPFVLDLRAFFEEVVPKE